jgi:GNAT superfamily N-acetyltransferase
MIRRAWQVLQDVQLLAQQMGWRTAVLSLRDRLFSYSESLLYTADCWKGCLGSVEGVSVVAVPPGAADEVKQDIERLGLASEWSNFSKGATCFLAHESKSPVGIGWRFASSRLLRRAGFLPGATYAGGFFVREFARGRGIYPMLLGSIASTLGSGDWPLVIQVNPSNKASRRGLEKAGFRCSARLRTLIVAGLIVYCRKTEADDGRGGSRTLAP